MSKSYWNRKIHALLHDGPSKVLSIGEHKAGADALLQVFGLTLDDKGRSEADWSDSAADRLPWPTYHQLKSKYDSKANPAKHPLSGEPIEHQTHVPLQTAKHGNAIEHENLPALETEDPRLRFLAIWRFWQNWASDSHPEFATFPADTRLPDHSIWSHVSLTSAMQGCYGGSVEEWSKGTSLPDKPTMALFSIGPVQEFIAAARTTRDLWSGSYLLSFLVAQALAQVAKDFGPDHVIFPNLKGQPLVDHAMRKDWEDAKTSKHPKAKNLWQAFGYEADPEMKNALATPSLPNRFLVLLPTNMAEHDEWEDASAYAAYLAQCMRQKLRSIADSVDQELDTYDGFRQDVFNQQVESMLEVHWQTLPLPETVEDTIALAESLPSEDNFKPAEAFQAVLDSVKNMPAKDRDQRYFIKHDKGSDEAAGTLAQPSAAWSLLYALTGWALDGTKNLRHFSATGSGQWKIGREHVQDALNPRLDACFIAPQDKKECERFRANNFSSAQKGSLSPGEALSAPTLIKRFWHATYLPEEEGFKGEDFCMPNTHDIANGRASEDSSELAGNDTEGAYFAIIALDGDEMGKWVSGAKLPIMDDVLSQEAREYYQQFDGGAFLQAKRALSPSFHLQFSEMLGNFSLHCVRRIIEAYAGRLIYAGGDDVLAMLPANQALACAASLRDAFRGDSKSLTRNLPSVFVEAPEGCIRLHPNAGNRDLLVSDPVSFPVLVPGKKTDVSCGVVIGHAKSPLQDLVKAAQKAEKRAKNELCRAACAVSIFKRSGEIIEWGFKWPVDQSPAGDFFETITKALQDEQLSKRFPYRMIELIQPLRAPGSTSDHPDFEKTAAEIICLELEQCLDRQGGSKKLSKEEKEIILRTFGDYWKGLDVRRSEPAFTASEKIDDLVGLLSTISWISKHDFVSPKKGGSV